MQNIESEYKKLLESYRDCCRTKDLILKAFDSAYEGIVITDPDGFITMLNRTYADFLGVDVDEAIGKHCTEVIENTRMHIVAKTKTPELAQVHRIKGGNMIAHRIPIIQDGTVIAVVGKVMFQNVRELHTLSARVIQLQKELDYYQGELLKNLGAKYRFEDIIGISRNILEVKEIAKRVALSDTTILISGESGTGKEMFAHAIHNYSHRKFGPFVRVNCAAIPDTLMESILFGYEEGAFTGALKGGRKGKFEIAHKGTIFLDEIGELSPVMQAKLLRVLQEREIERIGAMHPMKVDVRIIAASNRNLESMVKNGEFRQDLFYRLHVVSLHIPPLRERVEDIPVLARHLLQMLSQETGMYAAGMEQEVLDVFIRYHWPGNVRELKNVLERALHVKREDMIRLSHLPVRLFEESTGERPCFLLANAIEETERETIRQVLKMTNGDRARAIRLLGISKSSFYQKVKKYKIEIRPMD
ncbi:sigma 54-interacting transcriptional regulator [Thermoactinomyces daqus]|uniref:Sigma 54-interacting transcriptional regulator n=1 Tax=Thermoactinomyces daqus TaxID=1329516 RepID=A0A7W1XAZ6_9BACL|nr:sigma 54-interacting transcriptional regulator [Thermoactinomyces daqus]MBA4543281.1 sigma 54-interacting transcriptional regulator [Thermoactinomyces daqus]